MLGRIHIEQVWDWDRRTTNDFMGGCSFSISDILTQPRSGWFKLLDKDEAKAKFVPVLEERKVMSSDDNMTEEQDVKTREKINIETEDTAVGEIKVEVDLGISRDISDDPDSEIADITCKEGEEQTTLNKCSVTDGEINTDDMVNRAKSNLSKIGFRFSKTGATLNNLVSNIAKQLPDKVTGK